MDSVEVAIGNRRMTVEAARQCAKEWRDLVRMEPFLLGPVFFRTALACSGGYHLERWNAVT